MATKRRRSDSTTEVKEAPKRARTHPTCPEAEACAQLPAPGFCRVTKPAPDFKNVDVVLPDGKFGTTSLSDYKDKWLVLFFYPLDFTFVCPTEIIDFSERAGEFKKIGCEVVGASCDSKFTHLAWIETPRTKGGLGKLNIPLVADLTRKMSEDYGVMLDDGHPLRGLFIIDPKGTLRYLSHNDPPVGRNVDEVLRLVQAYQFTDENGEVCPSGWKPGKSTMKADPNGKLAFFETTFKA